MRLTRSCETKQFITPKIKEQVTIRLLTTFDGKPKHFFFGSIKFKRICYLTSLLQKLLWRGIDSSQYNRLCYKDQNELNELGLGCITHRVISDRVHRLLVTLSYFRPDRFVQLLSLIPILILLLYYLVSGCLTSLC